MAAWQSLPAALAVGYFRGRTALITGASSGIGRELSQSLARMGAKVALMARRQAVLDQLAAAIGASAPAPLVLAADVTKPAEVRSAVERALGDLGHLDLLVNSAGILEPAPVATMDPASLDRMVKVNLMGTLHTIQAVLPSMREAGAGNIVNIASLAGRRGMPPLGGYCASKFAVVGLTEALRVELYGTGVKVSLVMPGVIDTPMVQDMPSRQLGGAAARNYAMPPNWVTWAVIAAVVFGLAEVDIPPGAAALEKVAALMPGLTDGAIALAQRWIEWWGGAATTQHL